MGKEHTGRKSADQRKPKNIKIRRSNLAKLIDKSKTTHIELQQLMLSKRISISALARDTCIKENAIRGYLSGKKAIPNNLVEMIKSIQSE